MKEGIFHRKIILPLIALLKQGITPKKMALSLAFGLVLGIFPVLGSTTLLCALAAIIFRLNLPAIQIVNYLVYPLQLLLVMPFIRAGEKIFRAQPIPFSLGEMVAMFRENMAGTLAMLWTTTLHAIVAWLLVGPVLIYVLYRLLTPMMARLGKIRATSEAEAA